MMLDEPYRWAESVANRRDYIEDQLRGGSPVVGLAFEGGALLVTLVKGQQKVFEVYDRIALASIGHPTDIEKLRQAAIDLAHVMGFNYSEADVTLQQIVHFGLGPAMKTAFDEIVRSPYIARMLLAELDGKTGAASFYSVEYDGAFQRSEGWAALGGVPEADREMAKHLQDLDPGSLSLGDSLDACLNAWAAGRLAARQESSSPDSGEATSEVEAPDLVALLGHELGEMSLEAAVLDRGLPGKGKFRALRPEEAGPVTEKYARGSGSS